MTYAIDFDGIVYKDGLNDDVIKKIGQLRENGHKVVIFTSRQAKQLSEAEEMLKDVEVDGIVGGKYFADHYIDDRNMSLKEFLEIEEVRSMPKLATREYRDCTITIEEKAPDEGAFLVRGYAFKWEPYAFYEDENGRPVYEEFKRDAFDECDLRDVIFQVNHEGVVMARTRNNTLKLTLDEIGGYIEADLSKSQDARNTYEAIANGLLDKMSWGFVPGEYHFDRQTNTIVHTKVKKMFDVSAVNFPANDSTSISAIRSFADGEIRQMSQELSELDDLKLKTLTKIRIGGIHHVKN